MPEALTLHQFKERDPSVAAGSTLQSLFVLTFSKDKHESGDCFEWRVMQEVLSLHQQQLMHSSTVLTATVCRWGIVYTCCRVRCFWLNLWLCFYDADDAVVKGLIGLWYLKSVQLKSVQLFMVGFITSQERFFGGGLFTHWQIDGGGASLLGPADMP